MRILESLALLLFTFGAVELFSSSSSLVLAAPYADGTLSTASPYSIIPSSTCTRGGGVNTKRAPKRFRPSSRSTVYHGRTVLPLPPRFNVSRMEVRSYVPPQAVPQFVQKRKQGEELGGNRRLDLVVGLSYFLNAVACNLPIVLLPTIAAEQQHASSSAAFVASVVSLSTLGGGIGKILNGCVCQWLGGKRSMSLYMIGAAASMVVLSSQSTSATNPSKAFGSTLALIEFFTSIQKTAGTVVLANHYYGNPAGLASAITTLSLFSTVGTVLAKIGGMALLSLCSGSWSQVARIGAFLAMTGAAFSHFFIATETQPREHASHYDRKRLQAEQVPVLASLRNVLGSRVFWLVGFAHAAAFLGRTSDRILGSFYAHTCDNQLPGSICGGLAASVTLGFVHGLAIKRGGPRDFYSLPTKSKRLDLVRRMYVRAVVATAGLALCGLPWLSVFLQPKARAIVVALLSGVMASHLAFPFYQIPGMMASKFGPDKAIFLSLLEGLGYFTATSVWGATSRIVSFNYGNQGWSLVWLMLTVLFAAGGGLMLKNLESALP